MGLGGPQRTFDYPAQLVCLGVKTDGQYPPRMSNVHGDGDG